MIHFILTGGELSWQYQRALASAVVHGQERVLWCSPSIPDEHIPPGIGRARLTIPEWIPAATPHAHIWDLIAYDVLFRHGGICLGLDTISVRPMQPLDPDVELGVGLDVPSYPYWHPDHHRWVDHPYNNNGIAAPPMSRLVGWLYEEAAMRIRRGGTWGDTGPALLTELVERNRDRVQVAPFPQLCGFEGSHTWRFYRGEKPDPDTRVVHLFASAYPDEYATYGGEQWQSPAATM